ncbi:jg18156 [Pararge aegeria aegeria]|uniref:Jg18156 protein n=1 Tax=Pararge aegeria aegeria TaxID=348720 RepID=A0A8S4QLL3_9NEOP|nr:jg18156 [Pararge aegeria aegeria]
MESQDFYSEQVGNRSFLNGLQYIRNPCRQLTHQVGISNISAQFNTSNDQQNRRASVYPLRHRDIRLFASNETDKSVMCKICLKMYKNRSSLRAHNSSVHLQQKYQCTVEGCRRLFSTQYSRNRHSANPKQELHSGGVEEIHIARNRNFEQLFAVPPVAAGYELPQMAMRTNYFYDPYTFTNTGNVRNERLQEIDLPLDLSVRCELTDKGFFPTPGLMGEVQPGGALAGAQPARETPWLLPE